MSVGELVRPEVSELGVNDLAAVQDLGAQLSAIRQELPASTHSEADLQATADVLLANETTVNAGLSNDGSALEILGWFNRLKLNNLEPDRSPAVIHIQRTAAMLLERSAPALIQKLETSTNPRLWDRIFETTALALQVTEPGEAPQLLAACKSWLTPARLTQMMETRDDSDRSRLLYNYSRTAPQLLRHSPIEERQQIADTLVGLALDPHTTQPGLEVLRGFEAEKSTYFGGELIHSIAPRLGFDPLRLTKAWRGAVAPEKFPAYAHENLVRMCALEAQAPGICKALYGKFDIENFARCDTEHWLNQYKHMWETDGDHAFVQFPKEDYNGAFWHQNNNPEQQPGSTTSHLLAQAQKLGCRMRVYEFSGPTSLAGNIIRDNKRYGKAAFGVVASHMNSEEIGPRTGYDGAITEEHLTALGIDDHLAPYLPTELFMNGCTGRVQAPGKSFQKSISKRFPNVTILGGLADSYLETISITPYRDAASNLHIKGTFLIDKRWRLKNAKARAATRAKPSASYTHQMRDRWFYQMKELTSSAAYRNGKTIVAAARVAPPNQALQYRTIPEKIVAAIGDLIHRKNGPVLD